MDGCTMALSKAGWPSSPNAGGQRESRFPLVKSSLVHDARDYRRRKKWLPFPVVSSVLVPLPLPPSSLSVPPSSSSMKLSS